MSSSSPEGPELPPVAPGPPGPPAPLLRAPGGAPGAGPRPARKDWAWHQPEVAWPLSVAAGLAGTWLGLALRLPLVPALLATAAYAPLHLRLLARGSTTAAGATSVAWMVAVVLTVGGVVLDGSPESARGALLFSDPEALAAYGLARVTHAPTSRSFQLAWLVLGALLILLAARPTRGVGPLLAVALVAGAVSGGAADWTAEAGLGARRAAGDPADSLAAVLAGWPPGPLLALAGLLLASAALADPHRLLPLSELTAGRRRLLESGLLAAALALFFEPLYAPLWWRLVAFL